MVKSQKIKVEGKNHSFNVVCLDERIFARIKEHNVQKLQEASEQAKRISKEKTAVKIAALFAFLIVLVLVELFLI